MTTRERILTAARQLFTERGYHGTATRLIAQAAGISEGAIFRHFESKKDLLISLLTESVSQPGGLPGLSLDTEQPLEHLLQNFVLRRAAQFQQLFPLLKIVLLENEVDPELKAAWLERMLLSTRQQLQVFFEACQVQGKIGAQHSPAFLAQMLMSQLFGGLFLNQVSEGAFFEPETLQDYLQKWILLIHQGVTP